MHTPVIPQRLTEAATREFGDKGRAWLEQLPATLEACAARFGLELGEPVDEIKVNYVGYARTADGEEVVLKVAVPHRDFSTEMEALTIYAGRGINRLVDKDEALNAVVLERISPGTMLAELADKREQTEAAARVMRDLQSVPPPEGHSLPHFMDWMKGALEDARDCVDPERARPYVEQIPRVEAIVRKFMAPSEPQKLLHGDLHHHNILRDDRRGWVAIDPKGVIGARCLDIGRFVGNAIDDDVPRKVKRQQVEDTVRVFSEMLGESYERAFLGAFCDKVMGSSWSLKHPPGENEAHSQEMIRIWVEMGQGIEVEEIG